jgi:hypothetical protein
MPTGIRQHQPSRLCIVRSWWGRVSEVIDEIEVLAHVASGNTAVRFISRDAVAHAGLLMPWLGTRLEKATDENVEYRGKNEAEEGDAEHS